MATRGARDVAAQAFEFLALMRATAHPRMQAEVVRIGAQGRMGVAHSKDEAELALKTARKVEGVKNVKSHLRVVTAK